MTVKTRFDELAKNWEARPLLRELGISVREIEPGRALLAMERNGTNVLGVRDSINGGVQATCAELAAHIAIGTLLDDGERIEWTQDLSVSYVYSATSMWTIAEARVLRHGRLTVVDVDVRVGDLGENEGRLNAKARVTCSLARAPR
jgi:uncharacterized protein (TIGR00369 family)